MSQSLRMYLSEKDTIRLLVDTRVCPLETLQLITLFSEPVARLSRVHVYDVTSESLDYGSLHQPAEQWKAFRDLLLQHSAPFPKIRKALQHVLESTWFLYGADDDDEHVGSRVVQLDFGGPTGCALVSQSTTWLSQLAQDPVVQSLLASTVDNNSDVNPVTANTEEPMTHLPLVDAAAAHLVSERAEALHIPLERLYDAAHDPSLPYLSAVLNESTWRPRDYQCEAVAAVVDAQRERIRSGVLVIPCGGGKTLVGAMLICAIRRPTVVVCVSTVSVEQWADLIHSAVNLTDHSSNHQMQHSSNNTGVTVARIHGSRKDPLGPLTRIVITTYATLASAQRRWSQQQQQGAAIRESSIIQLLAGGGHHQQTPWGLALLDEVHVVPAPSFREAVAGLGAKAVVGLTATFVREDDKLRHLSHIVGPKLFDIPWTRLRDAGYLSNVQCLAVHCPLPPEFQAELKKHQPHPHFAHLEALLAAGNPFKLACVLCLLRSPRHLPDKFIIFCDSRPVLSWYETHLGGVPVVHGDTPDSERLQKFRDFESASVQDALHRVLLVSRVGDVSINLPSASVAIQVSSHGGSRRQEAQRVGRLLRPTGGRHRCTTFYALLSVGTVEATRATYRTSYLVDQGYRTRVVRFQPTYPERLVAKETKEPFLAEETAALPARLRVEWENSNNRLKQLVRLAAMWEWERRDIQQVKEQVKRPRGMDTRSSRSTTTMVKTRQTDLEQRTVRQDGLAYRDLFHQF